MTTESCTISYSKSSNAEVAAAEQALIDSLEKTCEDEMKTMGNQSSVMDQLSNIDSSSDSAFISMILCLVQECSSIAGAITVASDFMTDIANIVNLVTVAENEVGLLFEGADASSTMNSTEQSEMTGFVDSLNFLISSTITVTVVDANGKASSYTYTDGILGYMSDDRPPPSGPWPGGKCPMDPSAVDLVVTSAQDIEDQFTTAGDTWGNTTQMWNSIVTWANPIVDPETGIESYSPQYSKIMDDFQQINDQTDMQVQTVQYETQQLTTMYQQYQNLTYQIMQSLAKLNMAMVTNQGK
ncbi:MAG: hypothetical protein K2Y01_01570 [Rhabdochlamydiaceae bacterium]|nr:hypothetical protein [Rhabdochlamydiaceae bacterium]